MGIARRQRDVLPGTDFAEEVRWRNLDEEERRQAKEEYLRRKARERATENSLAAREEQGFWQR